MARDQKELYTQAQRRLVASLVYDGSSATRVFEIVSPEDLEEPSLELIISAIVDLARQDIEISAITIGKTLEQNGQLKQAGGISELNALRVEGERYRLEAPTELYAKIVKESSTKSKLDELLKESKDTFKDDSGMSAVEAISNLQSELSNALYSLADDATATDVSSYMENYFEVLEERLKVSRENEDKADGLQGIPSLVPSLNKYTSGWQPQQLITIGARTGVGKALALDTPIPTPSGWTTMGELQVGDYVLGRDGKKTKVVNATEIQIDRTCYEVVFNNGEKIIADADHRWMTETLADIENGRGEQVRTTQEIFESMYTASGKTEFHSIPAAAPIEFPNRTLYTDPYKMGVMLGEDVNTNRKIPYNYLRSSIQQRKSLLSGLLDSNATIIEGIVEFVTGNKELSENVAELVSSLGNIAFQKVSENLDEATRYHITFRPLENYFTVAGKVEGFIEQDFENERYYIKSITLVESVPVRCIQVDNNDHMYLAGKSMVPTHNTVFAIMSVVAAARAGKSVLFFSLEMSHPEIIDRIVACMSGVSMSKLKQGRLSPEELELVARAQQEFKEMKVTIDTDPKATVDAIRSKAFKAAQSPRGLDIIILDYLQLITPTGRHSSRQEAVAEISRNMKLTAKTLNVPVMVLVQLNRAKGDEEEDKLPTLDNIRESAAIAMDSDIVILLHRDVAHDDTTPHTIVILEKNRNGESQKLIRCHSNLECSLFREINREKEASERLTDEDMEELEDSLDLSEFPDLDDDIDLTDF